MTTGMHVTVRSAGGTTSAGEARSHSIVIDRPAEKGGTDQGPSGGDLLLLALGGCFMSTLIATAGAEGLDLQPDQVRLSVRGVLADAPTRFTEISVTVTAPEHLADALAKPLIKAERGCIVHNSIKNAIAVRFTCETA